MTVWSRTISKAESLVAAGAKVHYLTFHVMCHYYHLPRKVASHDYLTDRNILKTSSFVDCSDCADCSPQTCKYYLNAYEDTRLIPHKTADFVFNFNSNHRISEYAIRSLAMQMATSPKELAEAVDVILAMLADPAAALAVALGPAGAVAGLSKGGCTSLLVASK